MGVRAGGAVGSLTARPQESQKRADGLYLAAVVLLHLLPHELFVGAQDIPRGLITPTRGQAGGANHVRKQDGDGTFG